MLSLKPVEKLFLDSSLPLVVCWQSLAFLGVQLQYANQSAFIIIWCPSVSLSSRGCLLLRTPVQLD